MLLVQKNFSWTPEEEALYQELRLKGWGLIRIIRLGLITANDIQKEKDK